MTMKKIAAGEKIPPLAYRKLQSALAGEIRRYERCRALLGRVDADVLSAGLDLFETESGLAQWLCMPAPSLGGKIPLHVMRSREGRKRVAQILAALAHGNYL